MADWSKNNRACEAVWTSFYKMNQLFSNFDDSGTLQIKSLTFYSTLNSADLRKQQAIIIADELDNIFRNIRGAVYENNINRTTAMQNMVDILTDGSKTLSDLASAIDSCYKFWGEVI
jgi:hypothetical protein